MKNILIIGLTPPIEGGSQQHILEIVKNIDKKRFNVTVLTQKGTLCKKYAHCIEIPLRHNAGYFQSLDFYRGIKNLIRIFNQYDLIHIHESYLFLLLPKIKKFSKAKIILTVHGLKGFKFHDNKLLWYLFKRKMEKADYLIAVSQNDKLILEKNFNKKIAYIPNGVDISAYKTINPKLQKKIVFIGRIHEQKGIIFLLKAFEIINKKYLEFKLEVIGEINSYAKVLQKQFINKNIIWKEYVSDRKEIIKSLKSAYCIALPSLWEGLPLTLFEALASERPVILSDIPVFKSVIKNEALFFNKGDSKDLATKICLLIGDYKKANLFGKKGKSLSKSYSWRRITQKLGNIYEE